MFIILEFLFIPYFLGFNMKWRFMNKGFLSDRAHAMDALDIDPTETGRSRVRPGSPLSKEVGPSKSCCKKAALPSSSSSYKPLLPSRSEPVLLLPSRSEAVLPSRSEPVLLLPSRSEAVLPSRSSELRSELKKSSNRILDFEKKMEAIRKEKLKRKEDENFIKKETKYRQSKIYTVLKPALGLELSKAHSSKTPIREKILCLYTIPVFIENKYWEQVAEVLLRKEDESLWLEKIKEVRRHGNNSSFYKEAAEWLIDKQREYGGIFSIFYVHQTQCERLGFGRD
nr:hypothetical protein [Hansenia forbesii]QZP42477.1 hypothetical protein [Hansenia forbesii]